MSQQIIVDRDILMRGAALYQPNVKGPIMSELKIFDETFFTDADEHDWTETTAGTTIAHSAVDGGATTITGDNTATDDCGELTGTAQFSAASNVGVEIKAKISQITNCAICLGLADAAEATDDHIPGEISGTTLRTPTVTGDFCGFIFDTDQDTDVWYVGAVEDGTPGTPVAAASAVSTSLAPVADTYFRVRIQTDTDGNVTFYYNGEAVGYLPDAIAAASTDLLAPTIGFITRVKGAQVCTISRITVWQDCS